MTNSILMLNGQGFIFPPVLVKELVLADLQRVLAYVKEHEQEFVRTAAECGEQTAKKALTQQRKDLDKAERRMDELDLLFRKLYDDI